MKSRCGAFKSVSSAIVLTYAVLAIACVMVALNPIVVLLACSAALSLSFMIDGTRQSLKRLSWQLPVALAFALVNCLFTQRGATVFLELGPFALRFESFAYGALMGLMVMSALSYFILLAKVVSSDDAMTLFGKKAPMTALVTSMSLGMVPKLQSQERELRAVETACTCARDGSTKSRHANPAKRLTNLLATSLEDSLIRADSMRARGWGFASNRSIYKRRRMTAKGKLALALIALLGAICIVFNYASGSCFQFYPQIAFAECAQAGQNGTVIGFLTLPQTLMTGYLLCATYYFLPHIYLLIEAVKWRP